jgi:hypothetical protein
MVAKHRAGNPCGTAGGFLKDIDGLKTGRNG